jgi:hypothetical protein
VVARWPYYASVAVLSCECIGSCLAGSIEWGDRGSMVGIDSAEAAEQARFVIELYAIGAFNLLAAIPFVLRGWGWGWWLVLGMQVGIFVFALVEGILADIGWFFFSSLPLLTSFLLFAFRMSQPSPKPAVS